MIQLRQGLLTYLLSYLPVNLHELLTLVSSCLMCRANRTTHVASPTGVFWAINSSDGSLVWRLTFTKVEMFIDGELDDFNNTGYDTFRVSELKLRAFSRYAKLDFFSHKRDAFCVTVFYCGHAVVRNLIFFRRRNSALDSGFANSRPILIFCFLFLK